MMDEVEIKTSNKPETVKGEDDIDWISKMPDVILTDNILSLLNSKEAVQTCVLSKRWSKLWTFVPCLRISFYRFKTTIETMERDREVFENFVSSFLRVRDDATDLHHFSIQFSSANTVGVSGSTATKWVLYAAKHNPKKLCIDLSGLDQIHLPNCLFTCKSLHDVRLSYETEEKYRLEIKPDKVCLPNLTNLELKHAFINGDSMEKIPFGCPSLENLCMHKCTLEMNSISFRTVKWLDMDDCNFVSEVTPSTYSVSAPRVEHLYFTAQTDTGAKLQDMPMVTRASITVLANDRSVFDYNLELLSGLSGVENLDIEAIFIEEVLEAEIPRCSTFFNLKILGLSGRCVCCYFHLLSSFLELCPNLEDLTLFHSDENCVNEHIEAEQDQHWEEMGSFGCDLLREIRIMYSAYDWTLNQLVGLLLKKTAQISQVKITLFKYN